MSALVRWAGRVFARVLARELNGRPLYVVPMSRLGVRDAAASPVSGWTSAILDLELRRPIGRAWRGRGPAAVLADTLGPRQVIEVAAHEFAHRLDEAGLFGGLYGTLPRGLKLREVAAPDPARPARVEASPCRPQAVSDHGPGWCRLALHLAERAGDVTGVGACPRATLGYPWLTPLAWALRRHLWAEIEAWADRPLGWVKAQPLPPAFVELWEAGADDARRWEAAGLGLAG